MDQARRIRLAGDDWGASRFLTGEPMCERLQAKCEELGVEFVRHSDSRLATFVGWFAEHFGRWEDWRARFWFTLGRRIFHPDHIQDPIGKFQTLVAHELVHVEQQSKTLLWWWVARYLTSWRFRWRMEREAYLENIRSGDPALRVSKRLQTAYGIKLSTVEMVRWFADHLEVYA